MSSQSTAVTPVNKSVTVNFDKLKSIAVQCHRIKKLATAIRRTDVATIQKVLQSKSDSITELQNTAIAKLVAMVDGLKVG